MDSSTHPLLVPRVRLKADWPGCKFTIGDIFEIRHDGVRLYSPTTGMFVDWLKWHKYPHLFEPLPWYAERKESEMPEYIRFKMDGTVYRIVKWDMNMLFGFINHGRKKGCCLTTFKPEYGYEPATLADYTAYLQSQSNKQ